MHLFLIPGLAFAAATIPPEITFQSSSARTHLLELYTSEGCSSCPPAEKWMSQLHASPRLWKEVVPVVFHVDYWDGLGWPDRFASKAFTARQRTLAGAWASESVYTPAFALNGREWRERSLDRIPAPAGDAGVLSATVTAGKRVAVRYVPAQAGKWEVFVALLGSGLKTEVKAGENRGSNLVHDFVVLALVTKTLASEGEAVSANVELPPVEPGGSRSLAVWIVKAGGTEAVQAVGGDLASR